MAQGYNQPSMTNEGDAKANVLDFVEKGATSHKLEVVEQSLNDIQKTAGGVRVNVSIKVKGSMQDLVEWLAPLQKPDELLRRHAVLAEGRRRPEVVRLHAPGRPLLQGGSSS